MLKTILFPIVGTRTLLSTKNFFLSSSRYYHHKYQIDAVFYSVSPTSRCCCCCLVVFYCVHHNSLSTKIQSFFLFLCVDFKFLPTNKTRLLGIMLISINYIEDKVPTAEEYTNSTKSVSTDWYI